jgi:fimbrial chaperone protein
MKHLLLGMMTASALILPTGLAGATSLSITPISIEVQAPSGASRITLENDGTDTMNAQIRVFKWIQKNGKDELIATRDVVASPPAIKMAPGKKTVVRIVRTSKRPIVGEENYRLLVDEVPQPSRVGQKAVSFAIQYSVPVFFTSRPGQQQLSWNARISKGQLVVEAANEGTRRAKLSQMKIGLPGGSAINVSDGLAGYVLSDSRRTWVTKPRTLKAGAQIKIIAQSELGPVNATATVASQ